MIIESQKCVICIVLERNQVERKFWVIFKIFAGILFFLKKYHFNNYQVIYQKISQDVNITKDIMQKNQQQDSSKKIVFFEKNVHIYRKK